MCKEINEILNIAVFCVIYFVNFFLPRKYFFLYYQVVNLLMSI